MQSWDKPNCGRHTPLRNTGIVFLQEMVLDALLACQICNTRIWEILSFILEVQVDTPLCDSEWCIQIDQSSCLFALRNFQGPQLPSVWRLCSFPLSFSESGCPSTSKTTTDNSDNSAHLLKHTHEGLALRTWVNFSSNFWFNLCQGLPSSGSGRFFLTSQLHDTMYDHGASPYPANLDSNNWSMWIHCQKQHEAWIHV